jgi:hypothetical protein
VSISHQVHSDCQAGRCLSGHSKKPATRELVIPKSCSARVLRATAGVTLLPLIQQTFNVAQVIALAPSYPLRNLCPPDFSVGSHRRSAHHRLRAKLEWS